MLLSASSESLGSQEVSAAFYFPPMLICTHPLKEFIDFEIIAIRYCHAKDRAFEVPINASGGVVYQHKQNMHKRQHDETAVLLWQTNKEGSV